MKKSFALLMLVSMMAMAGCGGKTSSGTSTNPSPGTSVGPTSTGGSTSTTPSTPSSDGGSPVESTVKTQLATPVLRVDGSDSNKIRWDDVENADHYVVYVNGDTVGVEGVWTSYDVPLTDAGVTSTATVKAVAEAGSDYTDSEVSAPITVTHSESSKTEWNKEDFVSDWSPDKNVLGTVNEGLDLKANQSMAIVKTITTETSLLNIRVRDFEGQESGDGAKVQLKVNGTVVNPANFVGSSVQLDKACGREMLISYNLSSYVDTNADIIRIAEVSGVSNHCVVTNAKLENATWLTDKQNATTLSNYTGRVYTNYGELNPAEGVTFTGMDTDANWIKVGAVDVVDQGLKLQKESSVSRWVRITAANSMMTVGFRNFGSTSESYSGGVSINGTFIDAIGDNVSYFTTRAEPTYFEGAGDNGELAAMKTYDLSTYVGQTVYLTIANLKCYVPGGNEDLVVSNVSFASPIAIGATDNVTFDGSTSKTIYPNLPFMVSGHYTIFNEGVSFRSQDFASGIAQRFDLSSVANGKHVYVKTFWRTISGDNVTARFKTLVNGELGQTLDYLTRDSGDNLACVAFDLTEHIGESVDIGVFLQSRNYRIVLTGLQYYVSDTAETNISYPAEPDTDPEPEPLVEAQGEYAWGKDFRTNWNSEMGDENVKFPTILDSGWSATGNVNVENEGLKIRRESSISKSVTIDALHTTMSLSARSFDRDSDFRGQVTVKEAEGEPVAIKPIGYATDYFSESEAVTKPTYRSDMDDCENAVMYVFDLSSYIGKTVTIAVANLVGELTNGDRDAAGLDDRLIIGSIGFTSIKKVTESYAWDASQVKNSGNIQSMEILPAGPFSLYNEGINLRAQDFFGGFTKSFDLSDASLTGKNVKIRLGFRNFNNSGGEDIVFKSLLNGGLYETQTLNINESIKYLEFDVTQLVSNPTVNENVNLGIFIGTRTGRIVLTGYEIVVTDAVAPK